MVLGYGVDLTVHELARRLVAMGHSVDIWTPTSDGTYANEAYKLREIIVYGERQNRVLALLERNARVALRKLKQQLDTRARAMTWSFVYPSLYARADPRRATCFLTSGCATDGFSWKGKLNGLARLSEQLLFKPPARAWSASALPA